MFHVTFSTDCFITVRRPEDDHSGRGGFPAKWQDRRVAAGIQLKKTREFKLEIPVEVHHVY
jgi:hypothetical protein